LALVGDAPPEFGTTSERRFHELGLVENMSTKWTLPFGVASLSDFQKAHTTGRTHFFIVAWAMDGENLGIFRANATHAPHLALVL